MLRPGKKILALSICASMVAAALLLGRQGNGADKSTPGQPVLHWFFDKASVAGNAVTDRAAGVKSAIRGGSTVGDASALEIHSKEGGVLAWERRGGRRDLLPEEAFTAAGWIRIDRTTRQGALLSLVRGRADFRKGVFVGYNHQHFNFGFSSVDADDGYGRFTILQGKSSYTPGRWYYVAATYDGSAMRLYVNGELEVTSRVQSGKVQRPDSPLWLGRYQDDDTDAALDGALHEVALYKECLDAEAIRAEFRKQQQLAAAAPIDVGPSFIIEPYLQFPTRDSLTVMWESSVPGTSLVKYGTRVPLTEKAESKTGVTVHEVPLKGLKPETNYFYQTETTDPSGRILTSPVLTGMTAVEPTSAFSFAIIGDTQKNPQITGKLARMMWDRRPHFVMHLGDVVDNGPDKKEWVEELFRPSAELFSRVPVFPCIGNHEKNDPQYYQYFSLPAPKYYYQYSYGNADFFVVDTNKSVRPNSEQYQWLDRALGASTAKWKFVYHHHPAYSSDDNDYGDTWKGPSTHGDMKVRPLAALYEKHHVDVALNGHIHLYERTWPIKAGKVDTDGGVIYLTSGGGGGGLENFAPTPAFYKAELRVDHHYCYVTIQGGTFHFKAFDQNGMLFDSFELRK